MKQWTWFLARLSRLSAPIGILVALTASDCGAQSYQFSSIRFPNAFHTLARGVNANGQIVGEYIDANGAHGFLFSNGTFTSIDVPGAALTDAAGINDNGDVVGTFSDDNGLHGFLLSKGQFQTIDVPAGTETQARGISSKGDIVGQYSGPTAEHGFLLSSGVFQTIDFPSSTSTVATGVNARQELAGIFNDAFGQHGFLLSGKTFTTIDFPNATATAVLGLNDFNELVGQYTDANFANNGFVSRGSLTTLDFPGSSSSTAASVSGTGLIVGYYTANAATSGFLASPSGCQVNVQHTYGQCLSPWGTTPYDSHPGKTMCDLGCATSALAMALNAVGITQLPGQLPLDPGSLNQFMISTFGDYVGGDVQFEDTTLDVSFATTLPSTGKAAYFDDSLKGISSLFNQPQATTALKKAVCDGHAVIAAVAPVAQCTVQPGPPGGHYVLVTGEEDDSAGNPHFNVIDPGCVSGANGKPPITSLDAYQNQFEIRGFVADPASVSTVELVVDDNADLLVADSAGNQTGFDPSSSTVKNEIPRSSYSQDFLTDNTTGEQSTGVAHSVNLFQPLPGTYQITITGRKVGTYSLLVSPFSTNGTPQPRQSLSGVAEVGSSSSFLVQFSDAPAAVSTVNRRATFESTLADINNSLKLGLIRGEKVADRLSDKIEHAAREAADGEAREAREILRRFKDEVTDEEPKRIKELAAVILLEDADSLLAQLPQGKDEHKGR